MKNFDIEKTVNWMQEWVAPISARTLGWLAVILLHAATMPTLLAILTGLSDRMPSVDMVLLTWSGLVAMFAQACVQRNFLNIITIALGFIIQASLMVLIFFK
jgi:hypothetical protein